MMGMDTTVIAGWEVTKTWRCHKCFFAPLYRARKARNRVPAINHVPAPPSPHSRFRDRLRPSPPLFQSLVKTIIKAWKILARRGAKP